MTKGSPLSGPVGQIVAAHLGDLRDLLNSHGITNARLFGSVARGDDREGSDVDILIDVPEGTSLFDLVHIQRELEAHPGPQSRSRHRGESAAPRADRGRSDSVGRPGSSRRNSAVIPQEIRSRPKSANFDRRPKSAFPQVRPRFSELIKTCQHRLWCSSSTTTFSPQMASDGGFVFSRPAQSTNSPQDRQLALFAGGSCGLRRVAGWDDGATAKREGRGRGWRAHLC